MSDKECFHVSLKRQNVGNQHWYKCIACPQKFKAAEWDGKVQVLTVHHSMQALKQK